MKGPFLRSFAALAATSCLTMTLPACGSRESPPAAPAAPAVAALQSEILKPGEGAAIAAGQMAVMQYTGWLYENSAPDHKGKKFDSSLDTGTPFSFALGTGSVIKGWDQGVLGMKVGERRRLVIPPDLGYGDTGAGPIPPGATLVFDVELVKIE